MARALVISVIVVFDLIAFGLAVAAERRRAKGHETKDPTQTTTWCVYDSDIATGFGVGALLFLLVSQILVGAVTRCLCCGGSLKPGTSRAFAYIFFFLSWITFLVAETCLLAGAVRNAKHYNITGYFGANELDCEGLRKGTFAAGAAFTLFTMLLSIPYYMFYLKAERGSWKSYGAESGVGMPPYR